MWFCWKTNRGRRNHSKSIDSHDWNLKNQKEKLQQLPQPHRRTTYWNREKIPWKVVGSHWDLQKKKQQQEKKKLRQEIHLELFVLKWWEYLSPKVSFFYLFKAFKCFLQGYKKVWLQNGLGHNDFDSKCHIRWIKWFCYAILEVISNKNVMENYLYIISKSSFNIEKFSWQVYANFRR